MTIIWLAVTIIAVMLAAVAWSVDARVGTTPPNKHVEHVQDRLVLALAPLFLTSKRVPVKFIGESIAISSGIDEGHHDRAKSGYRIVSDQRLGPRRMPRIHDLHHTRSAPPSLTSFFRVS